MTAGGRSPCIFEDAGAPERRDPHLSGRVVYALEEKDTATLQEDALMAAHVRKWSMTI